MARKVNVLVTGGSGLLGRTLTPLLVDKYQIVHLDLVDPADDNPCLPVDLCDARAVEEACRGMDAIIHAGALHGRRWAEAGDDAGFRVNVLGTKNILEGARKAGVKRVVYTSSIWATGHGPNPPYLPIDEELPREPMELYGLTKKLGEQMCRYISINYGISTICLRPGGILPADAAPASRIGLLSAAVDVRDVAQAHVLALEAPADMLHETFCITADSPLCRISPEEWATNPVNALERELPGMGKLIEEGKLRPSSIREWYSIEKAQRLLGYRPQYRFDPASFQED